jgi:hypothetical protein
VEALLQTEEVETRAVQVAEQMVITALVRVVEMLVVTVLQKETMVAVVEVDVVEVAAERVLLVALLLLVMALRG